MLGEEELDPAGPGDRVLLAADPRQLGLGTNDLGELGHREDSLRTLLLMTDYLRVITKI